MPERTTADRLTEARKHAGFRVRREAVGAFGWSYDTYVSHENGRRGIKRSVLSTYADAFNVSLNWLLTGVGSSGEKVEIQSQGDSGDAFSLPVLGAVQGGAFMEAVPSSENDNEHMPVARDKRYDGFDQYLLKVRGPSMNKEFPEGSYAHCVHIDYHPDERLPDSGSFVIVERRKAGLVEVTIKEFIQTSAGRFELWPRSHDPAWQTPVILDGNPDLDEIKIVALVVGSYRRV